PALNKAVKNCRRNSLTVHHLAGSIKIELISFVKPETFENSFNLSFFSSVILKNFAIFSFCSVSPVTLIKNGWVAACFAVHRFEKFSRQLSQVFPLTVTKMETFLSFNVATQ